MTPDQERTLLSEIYAAGLDPLRWPDVMQLLGAAIGEVKTHMFGYPDAGGIAQLSATWGYDPDFLKSFEDYYSGINPWTPGVMSSPVGRALSFDDLLPRAEMKRSEYYNDWVSPQESICRGGGVVLSHAPGKAILLGGNIREKDADRLEQRWLDLVDRLAPAIRQAVTVSQRIAGLTLQNHVLRSGADEKTTAVLLLDQHRRILHANPIAEIFLAQGRVLRATALGALARLPGSLSEKSFALALRKLFLFGRGCDPFRVNPQTSVRMIPVDTSVIALAPFGPLWSDSGTVAMVLVDVQSDKAGSTHLIMKTLGLTESEAAVAQCITDGQTPAEIAHARQTSIHTIRNQLKSALSKTGTRRQAALALLIERLRRR
jgi:DNA-binding CsgD family transcriptional regulator